MYSPRKQPGFTLIEVLLATFVLVSAVYVLSNLQIRSMFRVLSDREEVERIFLVKRDFYSVFSKGEAKIKKVVTKLEEPDVKIVTDAVELSGKSSFKSLKNKLQLVQTEGTWKSGPLNRSLKIVGFVLKPEEKEQKK
jgi:prepilin-type N-terminal cleavage/methylation domain-containing protein